MPKAELNWFSAIMNATPSVNPCIVLAGTKTRYFSSLNTYAINIISPVTRDNVGSTSAPFVIANVARIPESAPVGPTILKLLPPKIEAINPAQIAVIIPAIGDVCEATANETDKGIDTSDTVIPDFQLCFKLFNNSCIC